MTNSYILICIQSVFVTQKNWNLYPLLATDLTDYIYGIVKQNGHKMIPISGTSDPIHLVLSLKPGQFFFCKPGDVTDSSDDRATQELFVKGRFEWHAGYGFSHSISRIGAVSADIYAEKDQFPSGWLIEKYLEFLTRFNAAYDDDLFLNLSFCIASPVVSY